MHCDPTMSHYLKILCDLIFGSERFLNDIVWERTKSIKSSQFKDKKFSVNSDNLLFYSKSSTYTFNSDEVKILFDEEVIKQRYPYVDDKGRFTKSPVFRSMSMGERPNLCYEYKGYQCPTKAGWKVSLEKLIEIDNQGDLGWSNTGVPYRKYRPEHTKGFKLTNIWKDIDMTSGDERLGYPTQKPEALLERIIRASSNEGDVIADFFCGCGTAISVAEGIKRKWIGVDISHLAVRLIAKRLVDSYGEDIDKTFEIHGFPKDLDSARELAKKVKGGRLEFEDWIIEVLLHGIMNERRNEMGFDGYRTFTVYQQKYIVMLEVKSGNTSPSQLNHFIKTVEDKKELWGYLYVSQIRSPGICS